MQQKRRVLPILVGAFLLGGVFYGGFYTGERGPRGAESSAALYGKEAPAELKLKTDFTPFWNAWKVLNDKFVSSSATSTPEQEKVWGAISGLASSLKDPYTVFLPPDEARLFESEISGNFEGVGMEIGIKDNVLTVIAPLKGTPAEKAGIRPGDKILKINDEVSTNMKVEEAVKHIRGPQGSSVRLTLFREGKKEPFEVSVVRELIDIPTIETETKRPKTAAGASSPTGGLARGVFIIRLYNFSATAPRLFRQALREFVESGNDKLIIDLRGNPGGFLEAAVDAGSWFIPAGKVIVTEDFGKDRGQNVHRSRGYSIFNRNLKMVVLVNNGSASASEILAGALQDYHIAKLVGVKTFGKGSVHELVKITPDTSLKVTVARWLTPSGRSISAGGLTPDIEMKLTQDDADRGRDPQLDKAVALLSK